MQKMKLDLLLNMIVQCTVTIKRKHYSLRSYLITITIAVHTTYIQCIFHTTTDIINTNDIINYYSVLKQRRHTKTHVLKKFSKITIFTFSKIGTKSTIVPSLPSKYDSIIKKIHLRHIQPFRRK